MAIVGGRLASYGHPLHHYYSVKRHAGTHNDTGDPLLHVRNGRDTDTPYLDPAIGVHPDRVVLDGTGVIATSITVNVDRVPALAAHNTAFVVRLLLVGECPVSSPNPARVSRQCPVPQVVAANPVVKLFAQLLDLFTLFAVLTHETCICTFLRLAGLGLGLAGLGLLFLPA